MAAAAVRNPLADLRTRARVIVVAWIAMLFAGVAYGLMINDMGDLACEPTPGSSDYGEFAWSVYPPGPTCTFTEAVHGFDEVRGPTLVMSVWIIVVVVGGIVCFELLRRSRGSGHHRN
ncbi:MAG: hypothetical protein ACFCVK_10160 [Acidimicrobiales bacterium]